MMNLKPTFLTTNAKAICCAALLSLLSASSFALEPFQASYKANIKAKLDFSGTLKRSLSKQPNGQWLFADKIDSLFASIEESSQVKLINNSAQPVKYHYLRKVIGKKKKRDISFDWPNKQAVNRADQKIALRPNTQDRVSYQLQLQLDLQQGKRGKFSYPVIKKDKIEMMKFVEVGTEIIKTPLGNLESIKLKLDRGANAKRETYIWFSTKHNFIISQLQQTEADGSFYSIVLDKLS